MTQCPKCGSTKVDKRNHAKRVTTSVGAAAGGTGAGIAAARAGTVAGEKIGGAIGAAAFGPGGKITGEAIGRIAGAVVAGLAGAAGVGSMAGELIDAHVLNNFQCMECSHAFSE